jgi:hypothetical protein
MAAEWKIEQVVVDTPDKMFAHWRVNAADGKTITGPYGEESPNTATAYGVEHIDAMESGDAQAVLAAVQAAMGEERVLAIEVVLEEQLADQLNPTDQVLTFDESGAVVRAK